MIMYSTKDCECQFCKSKATSQFLPDAEHRIIECPLCGRFIDDVLYEDKENKNIIATYLFYNKKNDKDINYLSDERYLNIIKKDAPSINFFRVTPEIINSYKYMSIKEKINLIMLFLGKKSKYMGDVLQISENEFVSASFVNRFKNTGNEFDEIDIQVQISTLCNYLKETGLIDSFSQTGEVVFIKVSIRGWQLIEESQKNTSFGKKVFIAMSFAAGTESTREALKNGISKAGYTLVLIDEVTHNHQIVPEMFKQIRDSKFLVIDVSVPNNGAYYEAGYALGQGKEVIFCCKKETFDDKDKRPHFDVSQKQMIVWEDEKELSEKLEMWIKSLFD